MSTCPKCLECERLTRLSEAMERAADFVAKKWPANFDPHAVERRFWEPTTDLIKQMQSDMYSRGLKLDLVQYSGAQLQQLNIIGPGGEAILRSSEVK